MKIIRRVSFIALLLIFTGLWALPFALAQGSVGYTKVASLPFTTGAVTFTTTTALTPGGVYNLEVTAANAAGESGPSVPLTATEPTTGAHNTGTVTITAGSGGGTPTTLNFYLEPIVFPNPPGATGFTLN